jgi:hypothetical protein
MSISKIPWKFTDENIPSVFPFVFINFLVVWLALFPLSFGQFSGSASRCDLQMAVSSSFAAGDDLFWFGWCCCCSLFCSSQSYFSSAAVSLCLMPLLASSMLVVTFIMLAIFKDFALLDLLEGCAPSLLVLCLCMFNAEVPLMPTLMQHGPLFGICELVASQQ